MADLPLGPATAPRRGRLGLTTRLAASPWFHSLSTRIPGLRRLARAEGSALFEVVSGFVRSQALLALVELRVLHVLAEGALPTPALAARCAVPPERMAVLLQAGATARGSGIWPRVVRPF
jgi:demethylspheroidene O-methyltransferase